MYGLTQRMKKEFAEPMPKVGAIFLIIVGIFLGTVFTVGQSIWKGPVTKAEAQSVHAVFSSYKEINRSGRTQEMILRFADHDQLSIVGVCISDEVARKVAELKPGAVLDLCVHPNSSTILEMVHNEEVIIGFDEAVGKLSREVLGFALLGIFLYLGAAFGIIKLIRKEIY